MQNREHMQPCKCNSIWIIIFISWLLQTSCVKSRKVMTLLQRKDSHRLIFPWLINNLLWGVALCVNLEIERRSSAETRWDETLPDCQFVAFCLQYFTVPCPYWTIIGSASYKQYIGDLVSRTLYTHIHVYI